MRLSDRVDKMETKLAAQSKTQSQSVGVEQSGDENETGSKLTDNQVGPSYLCFIARNACFGQLGGPISTV